LAAMSLPDPLGRFVTRIWALAGGEPPPCENCGRPTWDWRSVGWYCSDECKDEDTRRITL